MLRKFRTHQKKILWGLAVIIIPAFVLWGSLKGEKEDAIAKIGNRRILRAEFKQYMDIANLYFLFFGSAELNNKLTQRDQDIKAVEYLLLDWKADRENIKANDEEVVSAIRNIKFFRPEGRFNDFLYTQFLKKIKRQANIDPRTFEEYIRSILKAEKLYNKYIKVETSEREVKDLYRKDSQKAKIAYIFIPYEKFTNEVSVTEAEIEEFYLKNKDTFREEPKVKIKYAIVGKDNEAAKKILAAQASLKTIEDLKIKFSIDIKETDFIAVNDPIEGIGWQPLITKFAFSLEKKKISVPLNTNIGYIFIQKEDEKPARIPPLLEIKTKIEEKLKTAKEKDKARILCASLLKKINSQGIKDITRLATQEKLDFKETDYFKYHDYIEGLGLSEKVSKIIFSRKHGDIYPYPLLLLKGAYVVQLKEVTPFDEKDFSQKKDTYQQYLMQQKTTMEKMKFISKLVKEAKFSYNTASDPAPQ